MTSSDSVDVAIVGAGAAGLGAARRARERGLSFVVLEAMDRIGGRAHTEVTTFGVPWDRGCHWLHSADINPMRELADEYGFHYLSSQPPVRYQLAGEMLSPADAEQARAYVEAQWGLAHAAGASGQDVSFASVVEQHSRWSSLFRTTVGGEWSVSVEDASTLDSFNYRDTDHNWPVREGYGALVARHAEGLPVSLSTPVRRIEWGAERVHVVTDAGTISAGAVVITVSTKIIQDEVIAFDPPLPLAKQEAYHAIQLGNANKICFAVDGRELGVDEHSGVWVDLDGRQGMFFQLRPFGYDLANGYLAGELGAEVERQGVAAMIALGADALKRVYGNDIERKITVSACTAWQTDPWIRGAYGAARPGSAHLRRELVTPVDDKLFWAGEAVSHDFFSTCHGAHQTGVAAVESILHLRPAGSRAAG
jgi:monoamine oxidase